MPELKKIESPWMTAKEAALYLGRKRRYSYKALLRLAKHGYIRAGHDGKSYRFTPQILDAWMLACGDKRRAH